MSKICDLVVYICPLNWTPKGLFVQNVEAPPLAKEEKDGDVNIRLYLCPMNYYCNGYEISLLIMKYDSDYLCLLSSGVDTYDYDKEDNIKQMFLDFHNNLRETHPTECPDPKKIIIDEKLNIMAQWYAEDMLKKNYFRLDHIDSLGRSPSSRANDFHIERIGLGENIALIEGDNLPGDDELVKQFMEQWMNSPPHRKNIMDPRFNRIGIGFVKGEGRSLLGLGREHTKQVFGVVDFKIQEPEEEELSLPEINCHIPSMGKIRWNQSYLIEEYTNEEGRRVTRKVPGNKIIFKMKLPTLCVVEKILFRFEESPCKWELNPRPLLKEIPTDDSLHIVWTNESAGGESFIDRDGNLSVVFNVTQACFVPGEWMALYVWIRGELECNPSVWATSWFETKCFTSGIIQGCGIIEGNDVVEGGYLNDFRSEWIGDERVHWLVRYKGKLIWLKSSDWKEYRIGQRCFIYKNGIGLFCNKEGLNTISPPGCRWPSFSPDSPEETIISDSNVTYNLDRDKDIIVPYNFFRI